MSGASDSLFWLIREAEDWLRRKDEGASVEDPTELLRALVSDVWQRVQISAEEADELGL